MAVLTNLTETPRFKAGEAPSRGELTVDFLNGTATPTQYLAAVAARRHAYNGFNLIVAGGVLRTSTRPTLNILLVIRASA